MEIILDLLAAFLSIGSKECWNLHSSLLRFFLLEVKSAGIYILPTLLLKEDKLELLAASVY